MITRFNLTKEQTIPSLGFGTWQITGEECYKATSIALEVGYRHIDTAKAYGNHIEIRKAVEKSQIKREEIFITSKLWIDGLKKEKTIKQCKSSLSELGLDYLDLYLMHWPIRSTPFQETFEALETLKQEGLIKQWGVSNCTIHHLQDFIDAGFKITNNQVEFHPSLNQKELKEFCDKHKILLTAYSPIAQGKDLQIPLIQDLAKRYKRSASQIIINWIVKKGIVAIPKASSREHIEDNFKALEWELSSDDFNSIENLNEDKRLIIPNWGDFNY